MSDAMRVERVVPTQQGARDGGDIVNELFVLARSYKTDAIDGAAFMNGERDGEHIEIRVTVRSAEWVKSLNAALGSTSNN